MFFCAQVCAGDTLSPRALAELMRQQTGVSCQCHSEGDVSSHSCLSICLLPITHSLHLHPPASPIPLHMMSFLFFSSSFLCVAASSSSASCCLYYLLINISFLPASLILSECGVLERCSAIATRLLQGTNEGEGKPVVLDFLMQSISHFN